MKQKSILPVIHKAKNRKDAVSKLNMLIKDCKGRNHWDQGDPGNWNAMIGNLEAVKNWIMEDVSRQLIWVEVKK